jgi:hypothetical protein
MHSSRPMSVRTEIVELGGSFDGSRLAWRFLSDYRPSQRTTRRVLARRHCNGTRRPRAASKRPNCKGPPGLPCAVTPQGTWPPCAPSKGIVAIRRTSLCPVVDSCKGIIQHRSAPDVLGFRTCTKKTRPRLSKLRGALQSALTPTQQFLECCLIERSSLNNEKFFALYR